MARTTVRSLTKQIKKQYTRRNLETWAIVLSLCAVAGTGFGSGYVFAQSKKTPIPELRAHTTETNYRTSEDVNGWLAGGGTDSPYAIDCPKFLETPKVKETSKTKLYSYINDYRQAQDLPQYQVSSRLEYLAGRKAYVYNDTRVWGHSPDGETIFSVYYKCNNQIGAMGENLARGPSGNVDITMQMWKESPTHNAVLLDKTFKYMGLYVGNADIDNYVVLLLSDK